MANGQEHKNPQDHKRKSDCRRKKGLEPDESDASVSSDDSDKPGAVQIPGSRLTATNYTSGMDNFMSFFNLAGSSEQNNWTNQPVTATPVDDKSIEIDEDEKAKIREKAQQDVKLKIFETAIEAEATDTSEEEKRRKRKRLLKILTGVLVILLAAGGAGAAISLSKSPDMGNTDAPTMSPTNSPTTKPPIFKPDNPAPDNDNDDSVDYGNEICEGAYDIATTIGAVFFGDITEQAGIAPVDTCEVIFRNGVGVWYKLQGDGLRYRASTCDGTAFDTQISIFFGACGKLQCVAGNDQMASCGNGDQSIVAFATEPNINYYIYVHARRNAQSLFTLLVETLESNDQCENAIPLEFVNFSSVPLTFGSTRGASIDEVDCFGIVPNAPGVWYTVEGMGYDFGFGEYISVVLDTSDTDFSARVLVFEGDDCGSLRCVSSSGIEWSSEEGVKFYILIYGIASSTEGDFQFRIERTEYLGTAGPTSAPAYFQTCYDPVQLFPGNILSGFTFFQYPDTYGSCGDLVFSTSPGVWYDVIGTGGPMTVSTCESTSTFDTQISLFQGPCYQLECIDGNDQACGDQSRVSWFSQLDVVYHIVVHGYGIDQLGQFTITVEEVDEIVGSINCDAAIDILSLSYSISILGDTDGPSVEHTAYACGTEPENSPGVWYRIEGTGKGMVASTCLSSSLDGTTTRITVLDGNCDDLGCVEVVEYPCGSQHHAVGWTSELGKEYHIFVQAKDESSGAGSRFVLYVEEATSNVVCENAIGPLGADGSPTFGSTRSAVLSPPISDGTYVNDSVGMMVRGVWYTVLGTGTELVASTCSKFTDFGTVLSVYEGLSCSSLTEVELLWNGSVDCFFEFGWSVSWNSVEGELYYLLVVGSDSDSFGNFAISIETIRF